MAEKLEGEDLRKLVYSALDSAKENASPELWNMADDQVAIDMLDCSTDFEGIYTVEELVPYVHAWRKKEGI